MSGRNLNSVFYAETYHPIQARSIDGTNTLPHDNAIYRAFLCSSASLYDPLGDPKLLGDPYCTLFVGRLSHLTTEHTLCKAMSKYGRVKDLRLVRNIVTGASRGYAFVEYETEREMLSAYKEAHYSFIDDSEVIVDNNRQQLMPGWIPRRLGAQSHMMIWRDLGSHLHQKEDTCHATRCHSRLKEKGAHREEGSHKRSKEREANMCKSSSMDKEERFHKRYMDQDDHSSKRSSAETEKYHYNRSSADTEEYHHNRSSVDR